MWDINYSHDPNAPEPSPLQKIVAGIVLTLCFAAFVIGMVAMRLDIDRQKAEGTYNPHPQRYCCK